MASFESALFSQNRQERSPELDGIRGWACASVLIAHCITGPIQAVPDSWIAIARSHTLWLLLSGVDLFFVLSGFLIGGILIDAKNKPHYFKTFWIRRIARIFPVAYLMLATYAAAIFVTDHFHIERFNNWLLAEYRPPLWTIATFMQSLPIALNGYSGPRWMAMTWSLAIEEQFYMLFPFAVYFLSRRRLIHLVIAGIIIAPILRDLFERLFGTWYAPYVLLPSRMDALMYGVALALIVRNEVAFNFVFRFRRLIDVVAIAIFVVIVMNWGFPLWPGPSGTIFPLKQGLFGIMWAIVILRVFTYGSNSLLNRVWAGETLGKIGMISYGLYMYHQMINGLLHGILLNQEPAVNSFGTALLAFVVVALSVAVASVSYAYFELPIRRAGAALASRFAPAKTSVPSGAHARLAPAEMPLNSAAG